MLFPDQDGLFLCLFILLGAVLATCLHEFGHAIVAYRGGDKTVKSKGYLSLNPLKYTDVSTSLVLPIVFLIMGGFALPGGAVYINTHLLRGRAWKSAVSAAGPAATAVVAIALSIPFWFSTPIVDADSWFWPAIAFLAQIEMAVLILNLLPIPALDGYGILEPWLPEKVQHQLRGLKRYGFLFLLAMFWTSPDFSRWFWGLSRSIAQGLGIPQDLVAQGYGEFMGYRWALLLALVAWAFLHKKLSGTETAETPEAQAEAMALRQELNQKQLSQQPNNYGALIDQGKLLMRDRQYQQAVEHYSQALEYYPDDADFWMERGFAQARQKQFEAALPDYDRSLKLRPRYRRTLHVKADALLMLERYEESLDTFDQVLGYYPNSDHLWYDRGLVLQKLGRDREALTSYEKALKIDPKDDSHWAAVIDLQQELGETAVWQRSLQRGLKQHPQSLRLWHLQLRQLFQQPQHEELLAQCDRCERILTDKALPLVYRAVALEEQQQFSQARQALEQALEREPGASWILRSRLRLLGTMKCYDEALADLDLLLTKAPSDIGLLMQKAQVLFGPKRYEEAIALYDQLLTRGQEPSETAEASTEISDGNRVSCLLNKGFALSLLEQDTAAMDCYEQALAIAPNAPHGLANRGCLRIKLGQSSEGLEDLNQAVELEPGTAQLWKIRGNGLYDLAQWDQALASYDRALSFGPDIGLLCDRARCYVALGNADAAIQALQAAQALDAATTARTVAEKSGLQAVWEQHFASSAG